MLGRLLRRIRAGDRKLALYHGEFSNVPETILVTSKSFLAQVSIFLTISPQIPSLLIS